MFSILYVDDEPGLLEIGKMFLEQSGRFSVETLTSATEALEILRTAHYDAIISDYQMPVIDGIEFLKRVRASGNTVPFIIFTGRGREEIVIQAFNEGADFYLQKGGEPLSQFAELGHKVQKAILQKRAEASVRDHERREADIINFLPDATFAIDTRGIVIAWNRAMERMTGVPADQILGKDNYEYAIPFYHERRPILIDLVLADNLSVDARYPYIKREGKNLVSEIIIPHFNEGRGAALWFTASLLYDTGGNIVGAIESIRDITESKRAEEAKNESERRFRELADMLPQAIYEADLRGNLTYANRIAFEIFGYAEEDIRKGMSVVSTISPADQERAAAALRRMISGEPRPQASIEYTAQRKDGSTFPVSIYSSPILRDGRVAGLRGIIVDITERKRAEENLQESEGRFSAFMDHLPVTAFIKDEQFTNLYVNRHMEERFGARDWIGKTVRELFPPDAAEKMIADDRQALGEGYRKTIENLVETNGDRKIFETHKFRIDRENKPPLLGGFAIDITERQRADDELQNSVAFLNSLIDQSPTPMWISDETGTLIRINKACCALLNVTEEEMLGKYSIFSDNIVKEQGFMPIVRDVFEKGEVAQFPISYETTRLENLELKQFASVILDVTIFPVRDRKGKITHAVIQHADITRRREAEEALRESEQKYRTVFETTGTATVLIENNEIISLANSEFERLSGYPKDEIETRKKWTEFVVQEDLDRMRLQHKLRRQNHEKALTHYEFRFRTHSGEVRDIYLTIDVIPGTGKSVASLLDITERKQIESSLISANQEYTGLLDQIQDVYYRSDTEGRLTKASRSLAALLGYNDIAECLGRNISADFYAKPADRERFIGEVKRNGKVTDYEVKLKKKDGTTVLIATSSHLYYDTAGKVLGIEGTFRDITERKKQEHILRTQRDLGLALQTAHGMQDTLEICLNAAIEISGLDAGGIYLIDEASGDLDLVNSRNLGDDFVNSVSRYPAGSANGQMVMAAKPIYTQYEKSGIIHNSVQEREGLRASAIIPIVFKNKVTACLNIASHTIDEMPESARIALETIATQIGTAVEQIRAVDALAESEQRYRNIVEDQTEFICRFRKDGTHVFVNEAYCRYFSLFREDIVGNRFRPEILPEDRENLKRFFASLTLEHPVNTIVHRIVMPDGRIRWQRWSDRAIFDPSGNVIEYQSVGRDISEMKGTEEALRQKTDDLDSRNRLISTLLDTVPIGIFMVEVPSGKPIIANREATWLLGRGILPDATEQNLAEVYEAYKAASCQRYPTDEMPIVRGMRGESHHIDDMVVVRPDGTKIQLEVFGTPVTDSQGTVIASLVSFLDITERKRAEQVIREANRKINLLTSITRHDVGNQVIILRGFTKIALMKKPDPEIAGLLEKIEGAVSTIARQIEFTKEYQELGMQAPGWQKIRDIVAQQQITEGISLSCTCDGEVFADPMLERVFFNIIDNAVRHGESVTAIRVSCQPDPDGLVIVVRDDGVGVPPALKEKIFEKGYGKNTGFGLFLAREILAITGIIILETGTHGKGARFEIIVPKGMYRFVS
jgi:PAS domain S-box-containing protein